MKPLSKHIRNWKSLTLIGSIGLLLYGCALSKAPEHSDIVNETLSSKATIPPTWKAGSDTISVSNDWIKTFQDPELEAIIKEAVANNFDLQKAATNVTIASQNVIVVGSKLKPQIGLNFGYSSLIDDNNQGAFGSSKGLGLIAWEPDIWGKFRANRSASEAYSQATTLDFKYAKQSLVAITAKSWYQSVEANQMVAFSEEVVALYKNMLELVITRRNLGKVGDIDVAEANANLDEAQNGLLQAKGINEETKRSIEVLLGRYPSAEIKTVKNFPILPLAVKTGIPSSLLERRPDIMAAELLVVSAFRKEEVSRLNMLPSFSFNLFGGLLSDHILSLLKLNPLMLSAGIGMSVPVYTGGMLKAEVQIATAQQQQAIANYGGVVLNAFQEVENGIMYENLLSQSLALEQKVIINRTEAVRIAKLKYQAGSIDLLSVLQLQNALIASQKNLISLQNEQLANRINLHLALGGNY
ncbi:TolC family protein [Flavobacterium sp. N3904]|uniref:TolC family protein n=1 Tax=Flavobacterium sp. N3904 TaxID=2986835 RepID=UPI0022247B3D|nr:TolC family protein [Flavobacterium sp. N3904]